ncbi:hypothetical protein GCM10011594_01200 [Nakamurella endophytica]|uniref:Esterase n=1 Tax=Nakamurella endophytica TaxID=1748367 RepID=A0A917SL94_9ACTN|nr:hypothetical protein GCM10011594_01200 [Nakamurella endophytica]
MLIGAAATLVAGAGGAGLVEAGALPGRARLNALLGLDGGGGDIPDVDPGPTVTGSWRSAARGTVVGWSVSRPPGVTGPLPVAVLLHGRDADHSTSFERLGYDRFLAAATASGVPPFALATVDGGNTYWHRRRSGDDPQRMITDEFLPLLARQGLRTGRVGLAGWSMGGYGALLLGETLGPARVAAVAATSPALFADYPSSSEVAFDDADDFRAHDVIAGAAALSGIPVRVDCGRDDPFADQVRRLRSVLRPEPAGALSAGEHTDAFFTRVAPDTVAALGSALAT